MRSMKAAHFGVEVYHTIFWKSYHVFRERPIQTSSKVPLMQHHNENSIQALASPSFIMFVKEDDNGVEAAIKYSLTFDAM